MSKILGFNKYESLLEADQVDEASAIASEIVITFFDVYAALLPLADGYDKIIDDLESLVDGGKITKEDPTGKLEVMDKMIKSVSDSIKDRRYSKVADSFEKAGAEVLEAYRGLLGQFDKEDTEEMRKITNIVSKAAVRFTTSIKDSKEEIKENEDLSKYEKIFEAVKNRKERKELIDQVVATWANLDSKLNTAGQSSLYPAIKLLLDELLKTQEKLNDDSHWEGRKRKERTAELEEMGTRISTMESEITTKQERMFRRFNSNSDAAKSLANARKELTLARKELGEVTAEVIKDTKPEKTEDADKKSDDSESKAEYSNIDPDDIENSRKAGKNRERIKTYQGKLNDILGLDKEYKEIKLDGLYGKNTKAAVANIQKVLNKLGAGLNVKGILTAQTQKSIDGFVKNKDEIASLLKDASKNQA